MRNKNQISRQSLELLLDATRSLFEESGLDELLPKLLDKAVTVSGAERGYILLRDEDGKLQPSVSQGIEHGSLPEGDPSTAVISRAMKEKRPVLSRNAASDPRFNGSSSLIIRGIRSACCVPLQTRGSILGALYLDTTGSTKLTDDDLPLLETFGSLASLSLSKTIELDKTREALNAAVSGNRFPNIVGESEVMNRLYDLMERVASADLPVLISGESGTGKELIARALHETGSRSGKPFRAIFCGNLSAELLESELFGYKKGAFTGAIADKPGLLDITNGGVLFLDEIADVPAAIQAKLLRFLQDGEYQRVGDPVVRQSDVRIFSATNKDLPTEIQNGSFREDLYYRINVLTIEAPPLRDRQEDIPLLTSVILAKVADRTGQPHRNVTSGALSKLASYNWQGNVRELENVLSRAAVLASGTSIEVEDISLPSNPDDQQSMNPELSLQEVTDAHLLRVLKHVGGNRTEAARILGVSRRFIQKTLAKWREDDQSELEI